MEGCGEDKVIDRSRVHAEACLEHVGVVRVDVEERDRSVDHQVDVVADHRRAAGEGLAGVEEDGFQIGDDTLHDDEHDVGGIAGVDVAGGFA